MRIYPKPMSYEKKDFVFNISNKVYFIIGEDFSNAGFEKLSKELWKNFTSGKSELLFIKTKTQNKCAFLSASDCYNFSNKITEYEYEIDCTKEGICINYLNDTALIHAFTVILQMIYIKDTGCYIPCTYIKDKPAMEFRGIHVCIFPETSVSFIRKAVRIFGMLKYSHIVLEFWGTLKLDSEEALCWKEFSFTKDEIKPIIEDGKAFGIEFIPMFNHLGHAAASRVNCGKHVVLDQKPELEPLFERDGWTWDITNPKTLELLKKVRKELCDLFGSGKYFHLGCDEPCSYWDDEKTGEEIGNTLTKFLNDISNELNKEGRRPIIWADFLLDSKQFPLPYAAFDNSKINTDKIFKELDDNIVFDDWQYSIKEDAETAKFLGGKKGKENVLLSPAWDLENISALCNQAKREGYLGVLFTTWHKLRERFHDTVTYSAEKMWRLDEHEPTVDEINLMKCYIARIGRMVYPSKGNYDEAGFSKQIVEVLP